MRSDDSGVLRHLRNFLFARYPGGIYAKRQHGYRLANIGNRLTNAASCENLFQLFGPVNNHAQTASLRIAAQHNEPAVARHVVVRNGDRLPEVVFVREQGRGFPDARTCASRWKRAMSCVSWVNSCRITFSATSRPSFESAARYTSPIPPVPSGDRIS